MKTDSLQAYRDECIAALLAVDLEAVEAVVQALMSVRYSGRTVFIAGNGGSAATASHMANDLMLGSQLVDPPLRVVALTDNQSIITATGNDLDYDQIFSRQIARLAQPRDLLIVVSASGNSGNIVAGVETARVQGVITVAFTGFDGGQIANLVDLLVHVPTRIGAYGPVEDAHLAINHMITERLKTYAQNERRTS